MGGRRIGGERGREDGVLYKTTVYEFENKKQSDDIISFEIWNAYDVSKYSGWFDSKKRRRGCSPPS